MKTRILIITNFQLLSQHTELELALFGKTIF